MTKKRIAILGGGVGALSAAYGLTNTPGWRDRYDITVYQMGWRLGGKGACSRNPQYGQRIEEHGLHEWFGFYENAFATMRHVFHDLGLDWKHAFVPHDDIVFAQQWQGRAVTWPVTLPNNPGEPGDGSPFPSPWDFVVEAVRILLRVWHAWNQELTGTLPSVEKPGTHEKSGFFRILDGVLHDAGHIVEAVLGGESVQLALEAVWKAVHEIDAAQQLAAAMAGPMSLAAHVVVVDLLKTVVRLAWAALHDQVDTDLEAYRTWITIEFIAVNLIGVLSEDMLLHGFHVADDRDYKVWLVQHGMGPLTLDSCVVQAAYDSSFAFYRKNFDMEAGAVLRGAVRMLLLFKGSVIWRFTAGCADVVFAPLYQVLKQRGVHFEFFSKVQMLHCAESGPKQIEAITLERQARLKHPVYQPLIEVANWKAWPLEPLYDQLVEGEALQASGQDLESHWSTWRGETEILKRGEHFDLVVCGIPPEGLKAMTPSLQKRSPRFRQMLEALPSTRTQAFQLWLNTDLAGLGWTGPSPVLSCYSEPLDTWSDLSLLLPAEEWPDGYEPKNAAYFCGAMIAGSDDMPGPEAVDYPAEQDALAKAAAYEFITLRLPAIWPNAFRMVDGKPEFRWELLVDPQERVGPARLDSQFWRANIDPSERYVLSVPGSSALRLKSDQSGFDNLYLAGDWTDNGINAGCMEAAFISGLQASRGICGTPVTIVGEHDGTIG
jgi:uncharacterized protein with NAD-binding domain and iron-sulfur cluster